MTRKQKKILIRIIISALLLIILNLIGVSGVLSFALFAVVYLIIGYDILRKAGIGILNRRLVDENFLMAVATIGAFALAIYSGDGDYNEAILVMLLYQTGELFQSIAVSKSRNSISELMNIKPEFANIETELGVDRVSPESVSIGSTVLVYPGEKVPIDGVVIKGVSSVDTSSLTGESVPRDVTEGDEIISGCINLNGLLKIRTTKAYRESTVFRILELVEKAGSRKAKAERFISGFAKVYTPSVCIAALLFAIIPPVTSMIIWGENVWSEWIYKSLTFLCISCPCALVLSIPLTFFAGIGGAGRAGILIKGANFIEAMSQVDTIAFDKTGTLTEGVFKVTDVKTFGIEKSRLLEYAALSESASTHPVAKSIMSEYKGDLDLSRISDIKEVGGYGVKAEIDGKCILVGNEKLMENSGISCPEKAEASTVVHLAADGVYGGYFVISDKPKSNAKSAVAELCKLGIKRIVMLTGDSESVAESVGGELGIKEVYGGLLPEDKVNIIEKLISDRKNEKKLAFVGDGINDAPVLMRSDIGIAMGALGSDAAIEAADVVLMDDNPEKITAAIKISRRCMRIVRQNIVFSLGVKFLCFALVVAGIADMRMGIFADVGVMVIAVLNAIRALKK